MTALERPMRESQQILDFPERVALFISARHRDTSSELLSGFYDGLRDRALSFASQAAKWDSAQRQARLAHQFGARSDSSVRVQHLVVSVNGRLRAAVVACLPQTFRAQFPQFSESETDFPIAVRALAARLVLEAIR